MIILRLLLLLTNLRLKLLSTQGTGADKLLSTQRVKAEYDKWQFLKNKSDLKEKDKFRSVFLEIDMSREERAAKRERVMEKRRMGRERREVEQP